jgi:hypothetical protein
LKPKFATANKHRLRAYQKYLSTKGKKITPNYKKEKKGYDFLF